MIPVSVGGGPLPDGPARALFITAGGTLEIFPSANKTPIVVTVPAAFWLECAVSEVLSGTASGVFAIY